jgi:hypothetical protein
MTLSVIFPNLTSPSSWLRCLRRGYAAAAAAGIAGSNVCCELCCQVEVFATG